MRSVSIELRFEIHKHRATRCEFFVGDGLLKHGIALVNFGVECGGIKFLPGHCKLVNERQLKTAEALDGGIASAFRESRRATTGDEDRGHTKQNISSKRG